MGVKDLGRWGILGKARSRSDLRAGGDKRRQNGDLLQSMETSRVIPPPSLPPQVPHSDVPVSPSSDTAPRAPRAAGRIHEDRACRAFSTVSGLGKAVTDRYSVAVHTCKSATQEAEAGWQAVCVT